MLETDADDRPDEEILVERCDDGQFADDGEEDGDDVGEAVFGGGRWPDVIFGRHLRTAIEDANLSEAELLNPDLQERHVAPLVIERAGDVTPVETDWLWPGRIPLRRLTILAGDSAAASALAIDIAARVSSGKGWPDDGDLAAGDVLILSSRREIAETTVPALVRAGADLARTFCLDGVLHNPTRINGGWTRPLRLPDDLRNFRRSLRALGPVRLVVIDPIEPFLENSLLGSGPRIAAEVAADLSDLAFEFNLAVVGVAELRRGGGRGGMGMTVRQPALVSRAQAVWGIARDPRDPGRNVLLPLKWNAGRAAPPLEFTTEDGRVAWSETAAAVAGEDAAIAAQEGLEVAAAVSWVRGLFSAGPLPKADVEKLAREHGMSRTMLRRVTRELGVKSEKHELRGKATWTLPEADEGVSDEKVRAVGDPPARLDDSSGISNRAGAAESPRD
jgi:hypothetical protein